MLGDLQNLHEIQGVEEVTQKPDPCSSFVELFPHTKETTMNDESFFLRSDQPFFSDSENYHPRMPKTGKVLFNGHQPQREMGQETVMP